MGGVGEGGHGADWVKAPVPYLDKGRDGLPWSARCVWWGTRNTLEKSLHCLPKAIRNSVLQQELSEAEMEGKTAFTKFSKVLPLSSSVALYPLFIQSWWVWSPAPGKLGNERAAPAWDGGLQTQSF